MELTIFKGLNIHYIQGIEQRCNCIRYVNKELLVEEKFLGLYEMQSTTGNSLSKMFDVLIRLNLSLSSLCPKLMMVPAT